MSAPSYSDSPGSPTKYLGQTYRFAPVYIRQRDPADGTDGTPLTSPDIRPKENQGFYPVGSFWVNKVDDRLWSCVSFGIDANSQTCAEWILVASSANEIQEVNVQAGTTPIVPLNNAITVNGALVAAGTTPVRTNGTDANTFAVEVQTTQAIAATDSSRVGLAAFDSTDFSVDANGFVTLAGAGAGQTITGDTGGALAPTAGNWNILGGTNCSTSGAGSTLTINVAWDWTEVTGVSVNAAVQNGYILNNAGLVTVNLPGTCAVGDEIRLAGKGTGLYVVDAPAGDTIHYGNQDTSAGGTLTATNRYDSIHLLCTVADTEWTVLNSVGNFTVA